MTGDTTLNRLRRYLHDNPNSRHLRAAPSQTEQWEMLSEAQQTMPDETVSTLQVIEHEEMRAVPVPSPTESSALRYFLDGIQRPRILYYDGIVPVAYAYLSAVVRSRVDRMMCCPQAQGIPSKVHNEALYAPQNAIDAAGLRQYGIPIRDTNVGTPLPPHSVLIQKAAERISNDRDQLERDLTVTWANWLQQKSPESWLVVDGGIGKIRVNQPGVRLMGLAKTSVGVERILNPDYSRTVYGLARGERSSVFAVNRPEQEPVYSWFLRLHDASRGNLLFGLIRVEIPQHDHLMQQVNNLSAWLLEERVPLSVPDVRYDRLLYPMRDCEQYLRATAPSHAQLEALAQMIR